MRMQTSWLWENSLVAVVYWRSHYILFFPCFNLSFALARLSCAPSLPPLPLSGCGWERAKLLYSVCLAGCRCCRSPPHLSHHLLCVVTLSCLEKDQSNSLEGSRLCWRLPVLPLPLLALPSLPSIPIGAVTGAAWGGCGAACSPPGRDMVRLGDICDSLGKEQGSL